MPGKHTKIEIWFLSKFLTYFDTNETMPSTCFSVISSLSLRVMAAEAGV